MGKKKTCNKTYGKYRYVVQYTTTRLDMFTPCHTHHIDVVSAYDRTSAIDEVAKRCDGLRFTLIGCDEEAMYLRDHMNMGRVISEIRNLASNSEKLSDSALKSIECKLDKVIPGILGLECRIDFILKSLPWRHPYICAFGAWAVLVATMAAVAALMG